ncbi:immunity 70 family protein [Vreelandella venusta]|uniref:immunity 70 family protein n=1 Tax=Vreelandella venusta TaxID=44935 RepID=UPI0018DA8876|nr:immunity 70 family protein [Halomonas venusta]QPI62597.1 immunity 70 family protein [Halomonas venusta]
MAVGIKVGSITDEIGTPDFFHAFFSTVSFNLEKGWGSRFPHLLTNLYQGGLEAAFAENALAELEQVKEELSAFSPEQVVWDIEDLSKQPPWGSDISQDITSLANYFVASTGRDLIEILLEALDEAAKSKRPTAIVHC